jgi:hypothetical protein
MFYYYVVLIFAGPVSDDAFAEKSVVELSLLKKR